jgi:GNAT superfamily N-acetyltransferase
VGDGWRRELAPVVAVKGNNEHTARHRVSNPAVTWAVRISARLSGLSELVWLREEYRAEMRCQIIHDSIHERPGWTQEYVLEVTGSAAGYGSVAVNGPWRKSPTLYEFYVRPEYRTRIFECFETLIAACGTTVIETQTNDKLLAVMLHTYCSNAETESILFEDIFQTAYGPGGARVRRATAEDVEGLSRLDLDEGAEWVLGLDGSLAGAGGVLYHYNRPYGDVYMKIAEPFRRRGLGAYLVQELKAACRRGGSVPAARCNVHNQASRRTLQSAGFAPCANLIVGKLRAGH